MSLLHFMSQEIDKTLLDVCRSCMTTRGARTTTTLLLVPASGRSLLRWPDHLLVAPFAEVMHCPGCNEWMSQHLPAIFRLLPASAQLLVDLWTRLVECHLPTHGVV